MCSGRQRDGEGSFRPHNALAIAVRFTKMLKNILVANNDEFILNIV
jgi:hypothetical protein